MQFALLSEQYTSKLSLAPHDLWTFYTLESLTQCNAFPSAHIFLRHEIRRVSRVTGSQNQKVTPQRALATQASSKTAIYQIFQGISRYFNGTGTTVTAGDDGTVKPLSNWSRRRVPSTNLQPVSLYRPVPSRKSLLLEFAVPSRRDTAIYGPVIQTCAVVFTVQSSQQKSPPPIQDSPLPVVSSHPFRPTIYDFTKFRSSHLKPTLFILFTADWYVCTLN